MTDQVVKAKPLPSRLRWNRFQADWNDQIASPAALVRVYEFVLAMHIYYELQDE